MKTAHIYSLFVPVQAEFRDNDDAPIVCSIPIEFQKGIAWQAALLGSKSAVSAFRLTIPQLDQESLPDNAMKVFDQLRTYMLDCVRITHDPAADYYQIATGIFTMWRFADEGKKSRFGINMNEFTDQHYTINGQGIAHLFGAPTDMRPIIHLIADAGNRHLPLQFRFLSLYKLIEMHFRITPNKEFSSFAEPFIPKFSALFPSVTDVHTLCKQLSLLRNKCAHIKLSSGHVGFSHLDAERLELAQSIEIVREMTIKAVTLLHPNSPIRLFASLSEREAAREKMREQGLNYIKVV